MKRGMLLVVCVGLLAPTGQAYAQKINAGERQDLRERPDRGVGRESQFKAFDGKAAGPLTATFSFSAAYTSNAGATDEDEVASPYATPGLAIKYKQANLLADWGLSAAAGLDGDLYDKDGYDESRFDWNIAAFRSVRGGVLSIKHRVLDTYSRDFDDRTAHVKRTSVNYEGEISGGPSYMVTVEYQTSPDPNSRRSRFQLYLSKDVATPWAGWMLGLEETLALFDYRAGDNKTREDVFSKTEFTLAREVTASALNAPVKVGAKAAVGWNDSSRSGKDYIAFEVGPLIEVKF